MAAVQPHVAPRQHPSPSQPPAPAPAPLPSPAVVVLPCKRRHADVARIKKEGVAESCCRPSEPVLIYLDSGSDDEDDGCGSCVDGGESGGGQDEEEVSGSVVAWWSQEATTRRCFLWANGSRTAEDELAGVERDGDPKAAAAARRQEEDRKFWEACLTSGYP